MSTSALSATGSHSNISLKFYLPRRAASRRVAAGQNFRAIHRGQLIRHAPSGAVGGLAASEPSGHRDRAESLSKNRLAVLAAASVGDLSRERGSPMREFNPWACSHQHGLSPLHAEACGD
jgi:hypothetical protein